MRRYAFIGERQSPLAARKGWRWEDRRLCSKTIAAALEACGIDPRQHAWINLWSAPGLGPTTEPAALAAVHCAHAAGYTLVALGRLAERTLTRAKLPHLFLYHPAARGAIRTRARYQAHVRAVLQPPAHNTAAGASTKTTQPTGAQP